VLSVTNSLSVQIPSICHAGHDLDPFFAAVQLLHCCLTWQTSGQDIEQTSGQDIEQTSGQDIEQTSGQDIEQTTAASFPVL